MYVYVYIYIYIYESVRVEMATLITIVEMYAHCTVLFCPCDTFLDERYTGEGEKTRTKKNKKERKKEETLESKISLKSFEKHPPEARLV